MRLMDFLQTDLVLVNMASKDKEEAFCELTELLVRSGIISDRGDFLSAVSHREEAITTGIGQGLAVPHARNSPVDRPWIVVGTSTDGIEWDAIDGEPVYVIFLLVSPIDRPGDMNRMEELVSRCARDLSFFRFLRQTKTVDELLELAREWDAGQWV